MATIEQLEKQKQDLISSLNKIISETAIPINDRAAIIKELSRTIAEIAEQINKMTGTVQNVGKGRTNEVQQQQRKVEIKEIQKVKKELQPVGIPQKVEDAKWFMSDIIKVYKLDLSKVQYKNNDDDDAIRWSMFWENAKSLIVDEIKAIMHESNFKFPIVLQTSIKVEEYFVGKPELESTFVLLEQIVFLTLSI